MAEDWQLLVELAIEMEAPDTGSQTLRRKSENSDTGYEII